MPETYAPVLLKWKAAKLRAAPKEDGGDERYYAPLDTKDINLARAVMISCYKPFRASTSHLHPCTSY